MRSALRFEQVAKCNTSKAIVSKLFLPHAQVDLPTFMPVGTQGTMKGLTTKQLEDIGYELILANTYHMGLRPGQELLDEVGGLHKFMNWNRNLLTDSGGFQMVSLLKLAEITEEGVCFESPFDGSKMVLTPEHSMSLQNSIGADIIMQLDDVVSSLVTGPRVEEAMHRSIRWLDRCIEAHQRPAEQNLFAIIQGGLDLELRKRCVEEMVKRDTPGYAIGGLSGGEDKDTFWRIVSLCTDLLPKDKPVYCMGVGYAEDLVVCSALGVSMYDCVFPTRTARFGKALTPSGSLNIRNQQYAEDHTPLEPPGVCNCLACTSGYSRSYIHWLFKSKETVGCHLLSMHNLSYQFRLMKGVRESIKEQKFPEYVRTFFSTLFKEQARAYPEWCVAALESVNIKLL